MVPMPFCRSRAAVTAPTDSICSMGKGQRISGTFSRGMQVTASGFFKSLPILAKVLQKDTPTETVSCNSSFTARRMR